MNRRAILVGTQQYHMLGDLKYARNDAVATGKALEKHCNFPPGSITLMTCQAEGGLNAHSTYIEQALDNLRQEQLDQSEPLELLVFGFWGHGVAPSPGQRYLCGVETMEHRLESTALSLQLVQAKLKQIPARNTLIILDCCQNRPAGRSTSAEPIGTGEQAALDSMARDIKATHIKHDPNLSPTVAVLSACGEGEKAYEWEERQHGIFTAHFLDGLRSGKSGIADLAQFTRQQVTRTARDLFHQSQTPKLMLEGGDIPLVVSTSVAPNATASSNKTSERNHSASRTKTQTHPETKMEQAKNTLESSFPISPALATARQKVRVGVDSCKSFQFKYERFRNRVSSAEKMQLTESKIKESPSLTATSLLKQKPDSLSRSDFARCVALFQDFVIAEQTLKKSKQELSKHLSGFFIGVMYQKGCLKDRSPFPERDLLEVVEEMTTYTTIKEDEVWCIAESSFNEFWRMQESSDSRETQLNDGTGHTQAGTQEQKNSSRTVLSASEVTKLRATIQDVNQRVAELTPDMTLLLSSQLLSDFNASIDSMNTKFSESAFVEARRAAKENVSRCRKLQREQKKLQEARELQSELERLRKLGQLIHVSRHFPAELETSAFLESQASELLSSNNVSAAHDHIKESVAIIKKITSQSQELRHEEMEKFVKNAAALLTQTKPDEKTKQAITALARSYFLTNKEATRLVKQAWNFKHKGGDQLPADVFNDALMIASNGSLGLNDVQELTVSGKRNIAWPLCVLTLYGLVVCALVCGVVIRASEEATSFGYASYAGGGVAFLIFNAALLFTPVRVASRRPLGKRDLWVTILGGSLLAAMLTVACFSLTDGFFFSRPDKGEDPSFWDQLSLIVGMVGLCASVISWPTWLIFLGWRFYQEKPRESFDRIFKWLFRGSVLELIVAVPVHLYERRRPECSAGIASGAAILIGLFVAIMSVGPAMLILISERKKKISSDIYLDDDTLKNKRAWRVLTAYEIFSVTFAFFLSKYETVLGYGKILFLAGAISSVLSSAVVIAVLRRELFSGWK